LKMEQLKRTFKRNVNKKMCVVSLEKIFGLETIFNRGGGG